MYILYKTVSIIDWVLNIVSIAMLIYCILTWVAPKAPLTDWLRRITEPFAAPFHSLAMKICYKWGARIDFTYLFALIAIRVVRYLLWRIVYLFY